MKKIKKVVWYFEVAIFFIWFLATVVSVTILPIILLIEMMISTGFIFVETVKIIGISFLCGTGCGIIAILCWFIALLNDI